MQSNSSKCDSPHLLSEDDISANVAAALEPNSSAAVIVWENLWMHGSASSVRQSGGQLVASESIPTQELIAALDTNGSEVA